MRAFVKQLVARMPWQVRKLVMFFVEHGLVSRGPFSGVYASFDDVLGTMQETDQAEAATRGIARAPSRDAATNLPQLRRAHSLMPLVAAMVANERGEKPLNILDFGGAAGVDFANLLAALGPKINVHYHVVDFPKVCAVGRAHWRDDARITFSDALPAPADFDLVYGWSSIHYVADPLKLLDQFAAYRPAAILLAGSPFTSGQPFVRAQINQSVRFPQWVLSLPDIERRMEDCGYRLVFRVAGEDDYNVDNYPPQYRVSNSASLLFLKSDRGSR